MPDINQQSPDNWLNEHGDILYRYALLRVRSEATAEDLVQETLLAGIQAYAKFNAKSSIRTWLTGILKHKIVDHYRKNRHQTVSINQDETQDELLRLQFDDNGHWKSDLIDWKSPDETLNNEQFWIAFQHCLSRLPTHMADLFMLRTIEGLSSHDCCKVLGMETTNQLWVTLSRTRMKLRQCLELQWFENK